jgi:subtilisin family serine protease
MHNISRLIPSLKALAVIAGALALAGLSSSRAWTQDTNGDIAGSAKKYVLRTSTAWGPAQDAAIRRAGGTVEYSHAGSGIGVAASGAATFLRDVLNSGAFAGAGLDRIVQWQEPERSELAEDGVVEEAVTPGDDRYINVLWNMGAINASGAWAAGYDGAGVRVAVIDGGTCSAHPDVAPNLDVAASRSFVAGFNYDDDTGGPTAFRHACHVAGIIAARDNTIGTIGVAPRATIIACKALHNGSGSFAAVIEAILYASDPLSAGGAGANIINMSLGATFAKGGGNTGAGPLVAAMNQAVNYATAHNVLVVCSAGNNALDLDHSGSITTIPAQSGSGIAVSATSPVDWAGGATNFRDPATYTNYGNSLVWVAAPGGDFAYPGNENCALPLVSPAGSIVRPCWVFDGVLSPGSQSGSYFWASGTSMAAPHVAGVAALIVQKFPGISVGDLKTRLAQTADDEGKNGNDPYYGHGFINAARAVSDPVQQAASNPETKLETAGATQIELVIARNGSSVPEISFTLPTAGPAQVDLFDVAGRKVASLFNGTANAGRTTLSWNGNGLHQGAYFARLTAGGVQRARQIVLLGQ